MRILSLTFALVITLSFVSCAKAVSPSRMAYITAKDHGWIEFSLLDYDIPAALPSENEVDDSPKPPYCSIVIKLNEEEFVSEEVFPLGDQPPYSIDTGFRFPAPAGIFRLSVVYSGCDIEDDEEIQIVLDATVEVRKNFVTPVHFDGSSLIVEALVENEVVTLEDIDNQLRKIEQLLHN